MRLLQAPLSVKGRLEITQPRSNSEAACNKPRGEEALSSIAIVVTHSAWCYVGLRNRWQHDLVIPSNCLVGSQANATISGHAFAVGGSSLFAACPSPSHWL
jgi:hypothetical protein